MGNFCCSNTLVNVGKKKKKTEGNQKEIGFRSGEVPEKLKDVKGLVLLILEYAVSRQDAAHGVRKCVISVQSANNQQDQFLLLEAALWAKAYFQLTAQDISLPQLFFKVCANGDLFAATWLTDTYKISNSDVQANTRLIRTVCRRQGGNLPMLQWFIHTFGPFQPSAMI